MKIINLTPHAVTLIAGDEEIKFESQGVARAKQVETAAGEMEICGQVVSTVRMEYGEPEGLPEPKAGVYYIVSYITTMAAKANGRGTNDLLMTADLVRNEEGQIVGCRKFSVL